MKKSIITMIILLFAISSFSFAKSTFTADRIEEAVKAFVQEKVYGDIEIEVLGGIRDRIFEEDNIFAEFILTDDVEIRGICGVTLKFSDNRGELKELMNIRLRVRVFQEVPIAVRDIKIGDYLYGAVDFRRKEVTKYNDGEIATKESVKTCVARKDIIKGHIVMKNKLAKGMVIKRGQQVDVVVVAGSVQVFSSGQALTDAAAGEQCRIKRDNGKREQGIMTGWAGEDGKVYIKAK
jgi:flagella basal body P-ring formation protein FlgA